MSATIALSMPTETMTDAQVMRWQETTSVLSELTPESDLTSYDPVELVCLAACVEDLDQCMMASNPMWVDIEMIEVTKDSVTFSGRELLEPNWPCYDQERRTHTMTLSHALATRSLYEDMRESYDQWKSEHCEQTPTSQREVEEPAF